MGYRSKPLPKFPIPVADKAARTHNESAANNGPSERPLLQQRPQKCNTLDCFAQAHRISKDGALPGFISKTEDALVQKLHAIHLES